jgi:hypothetical protein
VENESLTLTIPGTSILAPDGSRAIRFDSFEEQRRVFDLDAVGLAFRVRLAPGAHSSRLVVILDPMILGNAVEWGFRLLERVDPAEAVTQIGMAAIGKHLLQLPSGGEEGLNKITCWTQCLTDMANQARASDDQILHYIKAKLYWAWKYDLTVTRLDWFDSILLGAGLDTLDRVSLIADSEYLRRKVYTTGAITYEPTPKLLREYPVLLTVGPSGIAAPADLLQRLSVPRYVGPRQHLEKAVRFMAANPPDAANATKEAVSAVEGLARIVTADHTATLGQLIDRLRSQSRLNPALAKSLEGLWGFASTEPGVRHGAAGPVQITDEEAEFAIGTSRAAMVLLLALDTE